MGVLRYLFAAVVVVVILLEEVFVVQDVAEWQIEEALQYVVGGYYYVQYYAENPGSLHSD